MIRHYPVMYRNILSKIQSLRITRPMKIADCNFGFGGHSHKILKKFNNCFIQGFDLDPKVIQYYKENFYNELSESQEKRLVITNDNFNSLGEKGVFDQYDVILADFGFNNFHISTPRGFSWLQNQDLDMRYAERFQSCKQIISRSSLLELRQIIQKFTDIKQSKYVADAIFHKKPINTTFDLRDAIVGCFQKQKQKKIAQVFQAFRIATNRQLEDIQKLCSLLPKKLAKNGLGLFITFHSIQRDIVIKYTKQNPGLFQKIQIQSPQEIELNQNSMSRSSKLLSIRIKR